MHINGCNSLCLCIVTVFFNISYSVNVSCVFTPAHMWCERDTVTVAFLRVPRLAALR